MSFKKCKVVMLPTKKEANSLYGYKNKSLLFNYNKDGYKKLEAEKEFTEHFHLYFLSDEKIKKGDWYLDRDGFYPKRVKEIKGGIIYHHLDDEANLYFDRNDEIIGKIIATTDSSLTKEMYSISFGKYQEPLPQPSQSFIEKYVEKYNKRDQITDVLVEYVDNGHEDWCERSDQPIWVEKLVPYINHKDNTITIKKIKDSWSRDEHITNLIKYREEFEQFKRNCHFGPNQKEIDQWTYKWIEENL